jgi:phosphatidylglycerophosphatase A
MKIQKNKISWIIATWFGSGLLPKAPGTCGSLAAFPFAYLIVIYTCPYALVLGIIVLFFIGIWVSDRIEENTQIKDPGFIVIDEVVGQWIALAPLPFLYSFMDTDFFYLFSTPIAAVAFAVFRILDIWKPWPANYADKNFTGGFGIMFDDVIAGMYALIITAVLTTVMVMVFL